MKVSFSKAPTTLGALLAISWTSLSFAQGAGVTSPRTKSSAEKAPVAADGPALEQAKERVSAAEEHFAQGEFQAAMVNYQKAFALLSGHPSAHKVLVNIALCQQKLLQLDQAIANYELYKTSLATDDIERSTIEGKVEKLISNSSYVSIELQPAPGQALPPFQLFVDGHEQPHAEKYRLPLGSHDLELRPDGFDALTKKVEVKAGDIQQVHFDLIDPYKEAKERVSRAGQLYEAGNYDAALTEFKQAYDNMVGHPARPSVLYNIARCQERLYRYDAAIASYRNYLETSPADEADRPKVEATIENLEGFLGTIELDIRTKSEAPLASYEVWVDARLVGENIRHFLIPGGTHQVEVRAEGFESATAELQVPARETKSAHFELRALAKEYKGLPKGYFFAVSGLTLAAAATGGVFGIMTITKHGDVMQKEPEARSQDDADAVKRRALYADVFFISAGVLATSATVLGVLTDWTPNRPIEEAKGKRRAFRISEVGLAPLKQGGFLSVGGSF